MVTQFLSLARSYKLHTNKVMLIFDVMHFRVYLLENRINLNVTWQTKDSVEFLTELFQWFQLAVLKTRRSFVRCTVHHFGHFPSIIFNKLWHQHVNHQIEAEPVKVSLFPKQPVFSTPLYRHYTEGDMFSPVGLILSDIGLSMDMPRRCLS